MAGLATYAPAVVATQQWYVGPGQQGDAISAGYDQAAEDRLFDADRLADRRLPAVRDRPLHRRPRLVRRHRGRATACSCPAALLEQVGGFDEQLLDARRRLRQPRALRAARRRRPASTSVDDPRRGLVPPGARRHDHQPAPTPTSAARRIAGYAEHYAELRGPRVPGPGKPMHYVGVDAGEWPSARRPAGMTATVVPKASTPAPDGRCPRGPRRSPRSSPTSSSTRSGTATRGRRRPGSAAGRDRRRPTCSRTRSSRPRPARLDHRDRDGRPGAALFLASICDLVGHGQVLSVGPPATRPVHPRITYLRANTTDDAVVARRSGRSSAAATGAGGAGLGRVTGSAPWRSSRHYASLVPVGSYVVIEDTIVNGHPVWPGVRPGPARGGEADHPAAGDFAVDPTIERYGLTFNPIGFLKRLRG